MAAHAGPKELAFLDNQHPVYAARIEEWRRDERRLRGGTDVLAELWPFEYEEDPQGRDILTSPSSATRDIILQDVTRPKGEQFRRRQGAATYLNFPDMFASSMVGHVIRRAPAFDQGLTFGTLGAVKRDPGQGDPSRAEQFAYNVDGVGNDGSMFWTWVRDVAKRAAASTGHRWVYVEAPARDANLPAPSRQDELDGQRPYWVEFSPTIVPDWDFQAGRLEYLNARPWVRAPRIGADGVVEGARLAQGYYLMVRRGCPTFAAGFTAPGARRPFRDGGWWFFSPDKVLVAEGDWERTAGEIPAACLYYERDSGVAGDPDQGGRPAMSRHGAQELGNIAVAYMNLSSAGDFDTFDAAGSTLFFLGADPTSFNTAVDKKKEGNRWIPVPNVAANNTPPTLYDGSQGAIAQGVVDARLEAKREEAREVAALEVTAAPDASGASKSATWTERKVPRLALMASEIAAALNTLLPFTELRWGTAANRSQCTSVVTMPTEFDIIDTMTQLDRYFGTRVQSGLSSPTVDARAMTKAATEAGLVTDAAEALTVEAEYRTSAETAEAAKAQVNALGGFGGGA